MTIQEKANKLKYIKNNLETNLRLCEAIQTIYTDDYQKETLVLRGGAAIQLYLQEFKRLFFDLDIDVTLPIEKRQEIRRTLIQSLSQIGYLDINIKKSRFSYSLDSFQLPYKLENGNKNNLKIDINYSYTPHLYPNNLVSVNNSDFNINQDILLINLEELIALKITALQERGRIKDLFDIYQIINSNLNLDLEKVKTAYLFYMTLSGSTNQIQTTEQIRNITNHDLKLNLYPLIPKQSYPNLEKMKKEVLSYVEECNNLTINQIQYINYFQKGFHQPEYLFNDNQVIENALNNPIAKWKIKLKNK